MPQVFLVICLVIGRNRMMIFFKYTLPLAMALFLTVGSEVATPAEETDDSPPLKESIKKTAKETKAVIKKTGKEVGHAIGRAAKESATAVKKAFKGDKADKGDNEKDK